MKSKSRLLQKQLLTLILVLTIASMVQPRTNPAQASPEATFSVVPSSVTGIDPGNSFTVDIYGYELVDIHTWQVHIKWTQAVLDATNVAIAGFLADQPEGATPVVTIRNTADPSYAIFGETTTGQYPGKNAEVALLATLTFEVEISGETVLDISGVVDDFQLTFYQSYIDYPIKHIPITENGYFSNLAEGDFSLEASPASLSIEQGAQDSSTITVTSLSGFNSPVDLTVSGAPSDVTATLAPTSVTPPADGSDTSTLTVTVNPTATPGDYTLTVTGTSGALEHSIDIPLEITPVELLPPVADFTYSPTEPLVGEVISFDATASYDPDGIIILYNWDFDDGFTGMGETVTHSYSDPDTYTVTLTVTDDDGLEDTTTADITVSAPPETVVYIDPSLISANPGGSFTIDVNVQDVTDLYSYGIKISFDGAILQATDAKEGPFLKTGGGTFFAKTIESTNIYITCALLGMVPGVDGSGKLFNVTFTVRESGKSDLTILPSPDSALVDSMLNPITFTPIDAEFYTTIPVAKFTYTPHPTKYPGRPIVGETVTFNATASYDPDDPYDSTPGGIASYEWNFGDGNVATVTNPITTHVYDDAGSYTVTLTVTDDDAETDSTSLLVQIQLHDIAIIDVTVNPTVVNVGGIVAINVTVLNEGSVDENLNVTAYANMQPVETKLFDYYDPPAPQPLYLLLAGENKTTTLTWDTTGFSPGDYTISIEVFLVRKIGGKWELVPGIEEDLDDNSFTDGLVTISGPPGPPTASFTYDPAEPVVDEEITFDASASTPDGGTIVSYEWDFGDGTTGTGMIATHTYTTADTYTVTLNVTDSDGLWDTETQSVTVSKLTSTITIEASPTAITIGEETTISGAITPTRDGATVTIHYRVSGEETWSVLTTVFTNETSQYSYEWTPAETGTYELKASWEGDEKTLPAESSVITLEVLSVAVHDIAITEVTASPTTVEIGETVTISVTVENQGTESETFDVTVYYDTTIIDTETSVSLDPAATTTLTFTWTTSATGTFLIKAEVPAVPGETDTADNEFPDGEVIVLAQTIDHPVEIGGVTFHVTTESNSTVSDFEFDQELMQISFNVAGPEGTVGFCNVTIPKDLLGDPFTVLIGSAPLPYDLTENATHYFLYFSYEHSTHVIRIIGTTVATPPIASFTYSPSEPFVGETVTFDASASSDPDGTIVSYNWDFGDGTTTTETVPTVTHTYMAASTYTVTLTVTDNAGLSDTTTQDITVRTTAAIPATVNIDPDTLNLKSKGKWITCYITLPKGYKVGDIDISTILLDGVIPADWGKTEGNVLMIKFSRDAVIQYIKNVFSTDITRIMNGQITLTVTGNLKDGTPFEGEDTINVISMNNSAYPLILPPITLVRLIALALCLVMLRP